MKFSSIFTRLKGMPSVALLAMACSAFGGVASAAPFTWNGSGSNSLWSTGSNWVGGAAATTGSNLIFSGQLRTTNTNNLTLTTGSISFANTNAANTGFVLTGSTLSLSSGAKITTAQLLTGTGTVLETIANDLKINGGGITLAPSGTTGRAHNLLISGNISNGTGTVGNNVTIASGSGAQVFLSGNNTNVGIYTVNSGAILTTLGTSALNSQATVLNGTINANGGTLKLGPLSGTGVVTTSTTGLQNVVVSQNGASQFYGSITDGSGTVALTKNGTGNLTLSGTSSYTGDTTINAGALTLDANSAISSASAVTINSGTLNYGRAGATTFANALNGSGTTGVFNITTSGTVGISSAGNFGGTVNTGNSTTTFTGSIANATVNAGPSGSIYGTGTIGNLIANDGSTVSAGLAGGGVGTLTVGGYTVADANVSTVFNITGSGTSAPLAPGIAGTDYDTIVSAGTMDYGAAGSGLVFDFSTSTGDAFQNWSSFKLLDFGIYTNFSSLDGSQLSTIDIGGAYDNLSFVNADQSRGIFIAQAGDQTVEFYAATGVLLIVPEPSSIILAGLGVGLAGFRTWRSRRLKAILNRAGSMA